MIVLELPPEQRKRTLQESVQNFVPVLYKDPDAVGEVTAWIGRLKYGAFGEDEGRINLVMNADAIREDHTTEAEVLELSHAETLEFLQLAMSEYNPAYQEEE